MINTKNVFISGKPGCGKTTLIREVCLPFMNHIGGFYTEEIRDNNIRQGFLLKTFDGNQGVLAKKGMKSEHKLNKYGLDLKVLEDIGVRSLKKAVLERKIVVIDEIGSMEVISEIFRRVILETINSQRRVLATIRFNSQPFTDEVKNMENTTMLILSKENYLEVKKELRDWLEKV